MDVTPDHDRIARLCSEARATGATVGFVPTMGALHEGHASLLRLARQECGLVVLSIFVNSLQFGPGEDVETYPRTVELDIGLAETLGADAVFTPSEKTMYPNARPAVTVDPGQLGERLEGAVRPGHFRAVLTVVAKLFNVVGPCRAYFGQKDAQQLALIRRMVADLDAPVEVVAAQTVREITGLALSSRNSYLSEEERAAAAVLFEALAAAAALTRAGERHADILRAEMARTIGAEPLARIDYAEVIDDESWEVVDEIIGPVRALVAAKVGPARFIDNLLLPLPGEA
jgi:pantoate--beta-alanine ligase